MVSVPVAYDVTRLFLGPLSRTPRGIDRVDFGLAARLFRQSSFPCVGVMPTLHGTRAFSHHAVRRGLVRLQQLWAERQGGDKTAIWTDLVAELTGQRVGSATIPAPAPLTALQRARRMTSLLAATGFSFGNSARTHVPERAVYVNVGHISLAMPFFLRWLDARPDVTPVFMLHDVIPLDTPEYVSPSSVRHHATMVASTARHAAGLLVTTQTAQRTVRDALARIGRTDIMTLAQPLPLSRVFDTTAEPDPALAGVPYFVICGAIEPRKNHELLFNVWRGLTAELGGKAPHLVIIGSPGWKCDEILQPVRNNPQMCRHVHVASGLSSPALKRLLAGAIALLMPSHAEGFGLPLIEAMRLGVPVMASDIPAHREVVDAQALLLDPRDPLAWDAAIRHWADGGRPQVHPRSRQDTVDERETYFSGIEDFLEACAAERAKQLGPVARRPTAAGGALIGKPASAESSALDSF